MSNNKPLMDWPERIDKIRAFAKAIRVLPSETTLMEFAKYAYVLGATDQLNRELDFYKEKVSGTQE